MSAYELVSHKELNMINCFCGFMDLSHHCTQKIKGTIKIIKCPTDCKVCEKEVDQKEYNLVRCKVCEKEVDQKEYNLVRWTTNHDGYMVYGTCYDKLGIDHICTVCFGSSFYSALDEKCGYIKD